MSGTISESPSTSEQGIPTGRGQEESSVLAYSRGGMVLGDSRGGTSDKGLGSRHRTVDIPEEAFASYISRLILIEEALFTVVGLLAFLFPLWVGLDLSELPWILVLSTPPWILVLAVGIAVLHFSIIPFQCKLGGVLLFVVFNIIAGLQVLFSPTSNVQRYLTFLLAEWIVFHGLLKLALAVNSARMGMATRPALVGRATISVALGVTILLLIPTYGPKLVGIVFGFESLWSIMFVLMFSVEGCLRSRAPRLTSADGDIQRPLPSFVVSSPRVST